MSKKLVLELRDEMRTLLTKYGLIKEANYDKRFSNLDELSDDDVQALYDWLLNFRTNEYERMQRVFRKPIDNSPNGPELWDRYFAHHKWHFIEMKMLRAEARITRDKWRECPKFKSIKNSEDLPDDTEDPSENCDENALIEDTEGVGV